LAGIAMGWGGGDRGRGLGDRPGVAVAHLSYTCRPRSTEIKPNPQNKAAAPNQWSGGLQLCRGREHVAWSQ
jgi:hypothetical protein